MSEMPRDFEEIKTTPPPDAEALGIKTYSIADEAIDGAIDEAETIGRTAVLLIAFKDIKLNLSPRFLVDDMVPKEGLTVVWGPQKQGKSFWLFDLFMHVALGWDYRGRDVIQGPVVYCYLEGQYAISARVAAFQQRYLAKYEDEVPFYLMPVRIELVQDHPALIAAIKVLGIKPAGIAIDTLNRSFTGSESSDTDMTAYVKSADAVRAAFECAVCVVHHCGYEGTRPRGHTALLGAHDALIAVRREAEGKPIIAEVQELKDGRAGTVVWWVACWRW
jgi:RecA-family ATPase